MNAVSLSGVEAVKAVAVTKKCWSHTGRMQRILLVDDKKRLCLIVCFFFL